MTKVPKGWVVLSEQIARDGGTREIENTGDTVEQAFAYATKWLDPTAVVLAEIVEQEPIQTTAQETAETERDARNALPLDERVKVRSVTLLKAGRKGIFGFGKKPNMYELTLFVPAKVKVTVRERAKMRMEITAQVPVAAANSVFWKDGGPIRHEGLYDEHKEALAQLRAHKRAGNGEAITAIDRIIEAASDALVAIDEFSKYHGYQRQQVAAIILGEVGDGRCISTLRQGRELQDRYAGCSQYSNRNNTKSLVQSAIDYALAKINA